MVRVGHAWSWLWKHPVWYSVLNVVPRRVLNVVPRSVLDTPCSVLDASGLLLVRIKAVILHVSGSDGVLLEVPKRGFQFVPE